MQDHIIWIPHCGVKAKTNSKNRILVLLGQKGVCAQFLHMFGKAHMARVGYSCAYTIAETLEAYLAQFPAWEP